MAKAQFHLIVEEGNDKGMEITVPPHGIRIGRSSNNDVVLHDPVMSRFHCRFYFKPDDGLWAEDLGSANQTLLNQNPMREARLHVGDRLVLGDTTVRVVSDANSENNVHKLFDTPAAEPSGRIEFRRKSDSPAPWSWRALLFALMIAALVAGAVGLIYRAVWHSAASDEHGARPADLSGANALTVYYEKVEAAQDNIFRYVFELEDDKLSIQIIDLKNNRAIAGNQKKMLDRDIMRSLSDELEQAGFFALKESYSGVAQTVWDLKDMMITVGRKTHRVRVLNTLEPAAFKETRERLEEFGMNELGLAALALSPEKLVEAARAAALVGRSLYDRREVKHENLAKAIRALREAEWYLETIEPKPDFYNDAVLLRAEAESELQAVYDDLLFLAERAIRLKDWPEASERLRVICEKIPERSDARHENARKKLIATERYLKKK